MPRRIVNIARKLLLPLFVCVLLGSALYFEGGTYQAVGAEALATGWRVMGYVLSIGLVLSAATLVHRLVRYALLEGLVASALGGPVPRLLSQLSALLIFTVAIAVIAGYVFKQDLTVVWAASGVAGIVIGMALRELLLDVFTGLALNLDRPMKIGDHVVLHGAGNQTVEGRVQEISWRSTRLKDDFDNMVIVPNSRIAASTITNHSEPKPWMEFMTTVMIDASVPSDRVLRILEAAAVEATATFEVAEAPPPYVRVRAVTLNGVEYGIIYHPTVEARFRGRSLILQRVLEHLGRAGLQPAWPKGERAPGDPQSAPMAAPDLAALAGALGATALFGDLPEADRAMLAKAMRLRRLPTGVTLIQAGEAASACYLVVEGLTVGEPSRSRMREGTVTLGPGSVVGGIALLAATAHHQTVRCRTETLVGELTLDGVRSLLGHRAGAARDLARAVAALLVREGTSAGMGGAAVEGDLAAEVMATLQRSAGVGVMRPIA